MTSFTDFKAGLENANDYLEARHHISGTTAIGNDALRVVAGAEYSFTLKELLCAVLGGNGFKLPNLQVCLHANISALLGLPNLQAELYGALNNLLGAVESFMDHTRIDNVLGRLNTILAEAQQLINLINFCSVPMDPIAIPNMLEKAFGSFLGAGKALVDSIGSMNSSDVRGCIGTGGFNTNVFNGGILGTISNNFSAISNGTLAQDVLSTIVQDIDSIVGSVNSLIDFENNIRGSYSNGGSQFGLPDSGSNSEVGVMHNPQKNSVSSNAKIALSMKSLYDSLGGYPVQYTYNRNPADPTQPLVPNLTQGETIEYPNIFHLLLEPEFLEKLQQDDDPIPDISRRTPVYDYCGSVIGYTTEYTQKTATKSQGVEPTEPDSPGYLAGGFATSYNQTPREDLINEQTDLGSTASTASDDNIVYLNSGSVDFSKSTYFSIEINQNTTFSFVTDHMTKSVRYNAEILITHVIGDITFPATVKWNGGVTPTFTAGNYHLVKLTTYTQGTTWFAESVSYAI